MVRYFQRRECACGAVKIAEITEEQFSNLSEDSSISVEGDNEYINSRFSCQSCIEEVEKECCETCCEYDHGFCANPLNTSFNGYNYVLARVEKNFHCALYLKNSD